MALCIIHGRDNPISVSFQPPALLAALAEEAGNPLDMPCGGKGRCGKCKLKAVGALSQLEPAEQRLLTEEELHNNVRLACLAKAMGDVTITLPKKSEDTVLLDGQARHYQKDPIGTGMGMAVDIGTTTVASYLYDLNDDASVEPLAYDGVKNPQSSFGADVISRIEKALAGQQEALADCITSCIGEQMNTLSKKTGNTLEKIQEMVITGNTAMLNLLTKTDVSPLAAAPFQPSRYFGESLLGKDLKLPAPEVRIYLPRIISAYVGADITTAILSSGMIHQTDPVILIDIGTNGEMALHAGERLVCCSTAAGPAFEGAGIFMGMPATAGAVSRVWLDGNAIQCSTIGDAKAVGICGSGIIDAMAALLDSGIVDETGLIQEEDHPCTAWITEVQGQPAVRLGDTDVVITQKDIRAIQLAKSAICAGIRTMLNACDITCEQVSCLYIAGGFGSFIKVGCAAKIGLIPPELSSKAKVIGNAAGQGASMILQSKAMQQEALQIAQEAETIELSTDPYFMDQYIEGMMFTAL